MSELLDHVEQAIRARGLFRPGQRMLVAVSGGVDSLVLLHLLHKLAPKHRWRLTVAHLNHQLRGRSSDADERLVRRAAARLKLPVVAERAEVRGLACRQKLSLEMAARKARHDFLASTAGRLHIPTVALAQHADDQVELFFLRLLRGSGGEGLAGMKWRNPSPSDPGIELVRPLLDRPKTVLCQFAAEQGIRHREDASNAVPDFQRNRIRHELLPLLRRKYQPGLDKILLRVMEIVGAEARFAIQAAREWLRRMENPKTEIRRPKSEAVRASLRRLLRGKVDERTGAVFGELPVAVQRRCVQLQLVGQGVAPDFELVEELRVNAGRKVAVSLARVSPARVAADVSGGHAQQRKNTPIDEAGANPRNGRANVPVSPNLLENQGSRRRSPSRSCSYAVRDRFGLVDVQVGAAEAFRAEFVQLDLRGRAGEVEFGAARICWRVGSRRGDQRGKATIRCEDFDADRVGSPVVVRHWRPGDRFQPIGMARPVKLQDFFTNQKVPQDQRRRLIVAATAAGAIFWVEGMRISERFKLTRGTIRRLQWRWKRL